MDIKSLLQQTNLLDLIDESTLNKIAGNLQHVQYPQDEIILREGELGDDFYIVASGSVRVFTHDTNGEEIALARLEQGNYFGEQALLEETPKQRNASVKAITDVQLLKIPKATLYELLNVNPKLRQALATLGKKQLLEKLTKKLSTFALIKNELIQLAEEQTRYFSDDAIIFSEGDIADYAYFILEGKIIIHISGKSKEKGQDTTLSEGDIFGELGILESIPRHGTARASGVVKVIAIPAQEFRELYEKKPELKKIISALYNIYQIPNRGIVTQYYDKFLGMDALNSIFKLEDGSKVLAARVLDSNIFSIMRMDTSGSRKLHYERDEDIWREAFIADGKLVGITNFGPWDDLGTVSSMVLDSALINSEQEQAFLKTGMFSKVIATARPSVKSAFTTTFADEIICDCMSVPLSNIEAAIVSGATQVEQVSAKTGAGTVCGSCRQKIANILGREVWFAASLTQTREHNKIVRTYSLKPINCSFKFAKPGQYVIVQAQINRNWVERAYTLTSPLNQENYEITIKCESHGLFSQWLFHQLHAVPMIRVSPPLGEFVFDTHIATPAICFAGGIGITPILTFALALQTAKSPRRLHIEYCAFSKDDFIFTEELQKISQQVPHISLRLRTTDTEGQTTAKEIVAIISNFTDPDVYICGPVGFEKTVVEGAQQSGIAEQRIHIERFVHAGGPP